MIDCKAATYWEIPVPVNCWVDTAARGGEKAAVAAIASMVELSRLCDATLCMRRYGLNRGSLASISNEQVTFRVWHATHVAVSVTPPHFCFLHVSTV